MVESAGWIVKLSDIVQTVVSYLHRSDVTDAVKQAVPLVEARIAATLRARANEKIVTRPISEGWFLPPDFAQMRSVNDASNGMPFEYLVPDQFYLAQAQGGSSAGASRFYTVVAQELQFWPVRPYVFVLDYFSAPYPPLVSDGDTNTVSVMAPQLYIYGLLAESFFWTQDSDLSEYARAQFDQAIAAENAKANGDAISGAPVMRRVR